MKRARQADIDRAVGIIKDFGATKIILFGSCARGSAKSSDIDIAVSGLLA